MVLDKFKKLFKKEEESVAPEFIEINTDQEKEESKIYVKTFRLTTYSDINPILNALREGYTIAVIDIKELKAKDIVELKRAIAKIKKTVDALEGRIAGFGDNTVIATPSKVFEIQKGDIQNQELKKEEIERF